ncbi:MAG: hypothetical protein CMB80_20060 [Flammeovirgaceae bacterium]|nr:hypothetical protein [Flammeovirgaceae bacterium]HCX21110.1 hypothetical protein [Cytophagales bacterium]|tara:strand:+ start:387 stop:1820 length:1434 start_codon:yes stop_codon:yes gene_type:complete
MSAKKRDISREEMRQYLEGKLKRKAAHEVERHLLENEFANDAMEGFEGFDQDLIDADIDHLKTRVADKKSKGFIYYAAAAVALLIVSLSSIWFMMDQLNDDSKLSYDEQINTDNEARVQEKTKEESLPEQEEVDESEEDNEPTIKRDQERAAIPKPTKMEELSTKKEAEHVIAEVMITEEMDLEEELITDEEPVLAEVIVEEDAALPALEPISEDYMLEEELVADIVIDTNSLQDALSGKVAGVVISSERMKSAEPMTQSIMDVREEKRVAVRGQSSFTNYDLEYVTGQITDDSGEPLPGVNVVIKGSTTGTISDLDGNYKIARIKGTVLNFSFIGLNSTDIAVGDQREINVAMESDVQALSEVVVTGYGSVDNVEEGYESARPTIGMSDYKDYLEGNLRYPEEAKQKKIQGKVILKVNLDSTGAITSIEIKRNLGFGCDEEAIRLVKEGPGWEPAIKDGLNIASSVRVKVKFELED